MAGFFDQLGGYMFPSVKGEETAANPPPPVQASPPPSALGYMFPSVKGEQAAKFAAAAATDPLPPPVLPPASPQTSMSGPSMPPPLLARPDAPQMATEEPDVRMVSAGGFTPAREVAVRGKTQMAAIEKGLAAQDAATRANEERSKTDALNEMLLQQKHVDEFRAHEERAAAEAEARKAELQQMRDTAAQHSEELAKSSVEPGRFWASQSTPNKIGSTIALFLGGFGGGENQVLGMLQKQIDRDIEAQKFSYEAKKGGVERERSAFADAIQAYGSVDAATSIARAAGLDAMKSEIIQQAAKEKGTAAQNNAAKMISEIEARRQEEIAKSVVFQQAQASGPMFRKKGISVPLTRNELYGIEKDELKGQYDTSNKIAEDTVKGRIELQKSNAKKLEDEKKLFVPTGPNGAGYMAGSDSEAKDHRDKMAASNEIIDLVDKLKEERAKLGYSGRVAAMLPGGSGTSAERIKSLSGLAVGAVNRGEHFGALDKGSTEVIQSINGDPLSIRQTTEAKLDALRQNAVETKRRLEQSVTGTKTAINPKNSTQGWTK